MQNPKSLPLSARSFWGFAALGTVLLLAATANSAYAQPIVHGTGAAPCAHWTEQRALNDCPNCIDWMNGFLSAYNALKAAGAYHSYDIGGDADVHELTGWMDNYCRINSGKSIYVALVNLLKALRTKEQTLLGQKIGRDPRNTQK